MQKQKFKEVFVQIKFSFLIVEKIVIYQNQRCYILLDPEAKKYDLLTFYQIKVVKLYKGSRKKNPPLGH